MIVVQILEDIEILVGKNLEEKLNKGLFFIMSDAFYEKIKILANHVLGITIPFREICNQYNGQDLNNKKLLALRHGGLGDILFLTTGYAELKRKFPQSSLNIAISKMYFSALKGNPNIDQIYSLPISLDDWNNFHYQIIFENLIENNPLAEQYNAYDLFMLQMGLDIKSVPPENKIPKLYIEDEEIEEIKTRFESLKSEKKKVGIQVASSSPIRNYPTHKFVPVIEYLISKDYDVYLFGSSNQDIPTNFLLSQFKSNVYKIIGELRDAIVISKLMDYFIAPDSMFIHIAGALNVPLIGIYGPFHSSLRMKYFKKSIGIDSKTACSPCFKHGFASCVKGSPSPCFSLITPEIVIEAFKKLENLRILTS
jgi:ADP-heptose:LPS heptosyltransferase